MIKKLLIVFIVFISIHNYAQQGTASPYSYYGIGSLKFKGTVENRSMGRLSIYTDSIHINLRNPASNATENLASPRFNGESRPIKYTLGGSVTNLKLQSDTGSDRVSGGSFDYLALAIPIGRLGMGFSLKPQTAVGYRFENINDDDDIVNRFRGEGGLNKVQLSMGYYLFKGLSIGVDANYNFGKIENSVVEYVYDSDGNILQFQSRESNRSDLSGLNLNFGLSYKKQINNKYEFVSGFTYTPENNLASSNQRVISTITISAATGDEFVVNSFEADLNAEDLKRTDLTIPSEWSFGMGFGETRKWFLGAEYTAKNTSKFFNPLFSNFATKYENGSNISVGGFFIPRYNSFSSYLKRVVYRAGMYYEKTGLNLNNQSIKEFGISFGLGLPVGDLFSNANVGFEFGKRGTTNNNLIQENFVNFQLSLSLNDRWFQKRKYD